MENLTKQQIVLLTLLVSFVTSIATGIVTVSLLDQAPPGVTQTINRVVERTIERVVQAPPEKQAAAVIQKETVVVREDDETIKAIEQNSQSIVRIYVEVPTESNPEPHPVFESLGIVLTKDGVIVADAAASEGKLTAAFPDGTILPLTVFDARQGSTTVLLKAVKPEKSDFVFVPVSLGDSNMAKLGQKVIAIAGREKNSVSMGNISSLKKEEKKEEAASTTPSSLLPTLSIETTLQAAASTPGAPLVTLSGDLIGIKTRADEESGSGIFTPSAVIKSSLAAALAASAKTAVPEKKN